MKTGASDRSPLLWILLPFITGIFVASQISFLNVTLCAIIGVVFSGSAIFAALRNRELWIPCIILAALFTGYLRYTAEIPEPIDRLEFPEREAALSLRIDRIFHSKFKSAIGFATVIDTAVHLNDLIGKRLYFSIYLNESDSAVLPGAELFVNGVIREFIPDENIRFHDFLVSNGTQLTLTRGSIREVRKPAPNWRVKAAALNRILHGIITRGINDLPDQTHTYAAMTLGLKSELSPEQKDAFLKSGAMHLFAISGLHVGAMAICSHSLLLLFRIPRKQIPFFNTGIILVFVITTGGAASAWRAFTMITCYYLAHISKRQPSTVNALILSALICLIVEPRQLFQAGFQMSYATVAAILMYGIPFATTMQSKWKPFDLLPRSAWNAKHHTISFLGSYLIGSSCICIAAFTTSSLLSIVYFDLFSTAGAIINLIYLPLASLVISAGFCSILCGLIFITPLSIVFNHAAALLLSFLDWIAAYTATNRFAFITYHNPHQATLLTALAFLLLTIGFLYARSWRGHPSWHAIPPLFSGIVALVFAILEAIS